MSTGYSWPLSISTFTLADKLKIAYWLVTNDRFTMGEQVTELERLMSEYSDMNALMTSSGSTANHLVFELWKVKNPGETAIVIAPAVTWISSVSPATMAGFKVEFCDINLNDLSFDYKMLDSLLKKHKKKRVIIFPTALIGYCPNMNVIHQLAVRHGKAEVFLDSCENTLARYPDGTSILASADMVTTSLYFSHYVCGIESGLVFFKNGSDYDLGKMFRNHGMSRSLSSDHLTRKQIEAANPDVDPRFLFAVAGTNLRTSDVHASFALRDMVRIEETAVHRVAMYMLYRFQLDLDRYYLPSIQSTHVPFCLPIFVQDERWLSVVKGVLEVEGIESRPIIGSHLGYQPCLKHLFKKPIDINYPNAEWIHRHGCYVGLHAKVTPRMIQDLCKLLNNV